MYFIKGALLSLAVIVGAIAVMLYQQRATKLQLAQVTTRLHQLDQQLARPDRAHASPPMTPPPAPIEPQANAARVATLVHAQGDAPAGGEATPAQATQTE